MSELRISLAGPVNFRDLGGYETASGEITRWGRVYRADALHRMTVADLVAYDDLGIRMVFDLRGDTERERNPDPFDSHHLPVVAQGHIDQTAWAEMQRHEDGETWLRDLYIGLLADAGPMFGEMFRAMADPDGLPLLFHCSAGKDRTGVTAALLLLWLGVPVETVLDDYTIAPEWVASGHEHDVLAMLVEAGMSREAAAGSLGAPRAAMAEALAVVDAAHGGIEAYLRGPAGLDGATLDALRRELLTAP